MIYSRKNRRTGETLWYIRYELPDEGTGARRRRQERFASKTDAKERLEIVRGTILNRTFVDPKAPAPVKDDGPTLGAFVDRFLRDYASLKRSDFYEDALKRVVEQFGGARLLKDITRTDVERFITARRSKVTGSTVRRNVAGLVKMLNKAVEWGVLPANVAAKMEKPPENQPHRRYLNRDEVERLRDTSPPWLRPLIMMAVGTGMRLGEVVALRWDEIDRGAGVLTVGPGNKTNRMRHVPIGRRAAEVLDGQVRHLRSPFVFVDSVGEPYTSESARNDITKATTAAMKAAEIAGATFKTLRTTAGSLMVQGGFPIYGVSKILGHSTVEITEKHYAHLAPEHLRGGIAALDAALGPKPAGHISATSQESRAAAGSGGSSQA